MIQVRELTKYYGDLCAVDRVSLEVKRGEILGLLGPNGAGKTTILRILTGYLQPTSGGILVKDLRIDEHPLEIKRLMGYLPESAPLYHEMLVYDYLHYVAHIHGISAENNGRLSRIRHLADLCGLNEVMHKPIGHLSKGYKQRVGLAHAMMNNPEILILDEPTSGLDPNQIADIREIIREIGSEKTVIISTHILSEAEATCNRIVIIDRGRTVADDSTETLKRTAGSEYTINLSLKNADFGEVERLLTPIEGITGIQPPDEEHDEVLDLRLFCNSPVDIREDVFLRIKDTEWIMLELSKEAMTLEKIFQQLTKE